MSSGFFGRGVWARAALFMSALLFAPMAAAQSGDIAVPKTGGQLKFVVGGKMPSFDGHRESTYGMLQPVRPFYSLLLRVNPDNPQNTADFVCDLCTGWTVSADGTVYRFDIRRDVTFHNGQPLTAHDLVATYDKIVFPPEGVRSRRRALYAMVEEFRADGDYTFVAALKHPSGAFLAAMANPFNFVYSRADLETHGYDWHQKNINGTGAFKLAAHEAGNALVGTRYENYHHKDKDGRALPYLDGFRAVRTPKIVARLDAIRRDMAAIDFYAYPPHTVDYMQGELGDDFAMQVSDWNCVTGYAVNQGFKGLPELADVRVRQALSLALDRRRGAEMLSENARIKTVGGIVFPGHPLAATAAELDSIPGFGGDAAANRERVGQLLREAVAEGLSFKLLNRSVNQPYKLVGNWLAEQWNEAGFDVNHLPVPTGNWYKGIARTKDFHVTLDINCQSVVNPLLDTAKWKSADRVRNNWAGYTDRTLDDWHAQMNRSLDEREVRTLMRQFERRVLWDEARWGALFWWNRILMYRSYVKGYNIAPSHYLNQHLDRVWLDK